MFVYTACHIAWCQLVILLGVVCTFFGIVVTVLVYIFVAEFENGYCYFHCIQLLMFYAFITYNLALLLFLRKNVGKVFTGSND